MASIDQEFEWRNPAPAPIASRLAEFSFTWERVRHWGWMSGLSLVDQGLFAGSNFLLNVLLARWLTIAQYGTFALAYSLFIFFATFHNAAFIEPMLVFGPGKYSRMIGEYLGVLIRGHFLVLLPVSMMLAITGGILLHWSSALVGRTFLALALAVPFLLLMWLLRRVFYVESRPSGAIFGGALYLLALVPLLYGVHAVNRVSTVTSLLLMAGSAIIASLFFLTLLRPRWDLDIQGEKFAEICLAHWRYGRWSIAASLVSYLPINIYYFVLPARSGLEGTATLRAVMNLINPVLHVLIAFGVLLLPTLVRNRQSGGVKQMNRSMAVTLCLFLAGTGLFSVTLWLSRASVLHLLYGERYQGAGGGAFLFLLLSLLGTCITSVLGAGLMALERPDRNLWAYLGSTIVALAVGLPLVAARGVEGAARGIFLSTLVAAGLMYFFYRRASSGGTAGAEKYGAEAHLLGDGNGTASRML